VNVRDFTDAEEKCGAAPNHVVLKKVMKKDAEIQHDVVNARKKNNCAEII